MSNHKQTGSYYKKMNAWSSRVPIGDRVPLQERVASRASLESDDLTLLDMASNLVFSIKYMLGFYEKKSSTKTPDEQPEKQKTCGDFWKSLVARESQSVDLQR